MMTSNERSGLTEPLESVTRFFGALMIIAALVGVAFLVFGSGSTYGGLPGNVCVTQPGTTYGSGGHSYMVVAGLRFDTVALAETGSRWTPDMTSTRGFVARHPAGY